MRGAVGRPLTSLRNQFAVAKSQDSVHQFKAVIDLLLRCEEVFKMLPK